MAPTSAQRRARDVARSVTIRLRSAVPAVIVTNSPPRHACAQRHPPSDRRGHLPPPQVVRHVPAPRRCMFFTRTRPSLPDPDQALPGRASGPSTLPRSTSCSTPRRHRRGARGLRGRDLRPRLLLGRRGDLLAGPRRLVDVGRLRRRQHPAPVVRRGLLRPHRPHRGGPDRLRPRRSSRTPTW